MLVYWWVGIVILEGKCRGCWARVDPSYGSVGRKDTKGDHSDHSLADEVTKAGVEIGHRLLIVVD